MNWLQLIQSQLSTWQADLNTYRNSRSEMNTTLKQELKDKELYIVRSPISGTIDQFSGIYRGSSIQAGQSLAVISRIPHCVWRYMLLLEISVL